MCTQFALSRRGVWTSRTAARMDLRVNDATPSSRRCLPARVRSPSPLRCGDRTREFSGEQAQPHAFDPCLAKTSWCLPQGSSLVVANAVRGLIRSALRCGTVGSPLVSSLEVSGGRQRERAKKDDIPRRETPPVAGRVSGNAAVHRRHEVRDGPIKTRERRPLTQNQLQLATPTLHPRTLHPLGAPAQGSRLASRQDHTPFLPSPPECGRTPSGFGTWSEKGERCTGTAIYDTCAVARPM